MINNVSLTGRLTRDPEVKSTGNNGAVCNFTIAVNRTFKNQQGEYEADFINVVAFNHSANALGKYTKKGSLVGVEGRIQTRNYENNMGQRVYVTEVIANNIHCLEKIENNNFNQNNDNAWERDLPNFDIDDDDLPF